MPSLRDASRAVLIGLLVAAIAPTVATARTLKVGPDEKFQVPSAAAKAAKDGDVIEIAEGTYDGGIAVWRQNGLTIRGVGDVEIRAAGKNARGMGIWVIEGNDTTVENITLSGARVPHKNGAGIRQVGSNLTIKRCRFVDNENGILAGRSKKNKGESEIVVEDSVFERNGHSNGKAHAIYVANLTRLTVRG
ncbi:MAG: right-handed parallel beta-helix repeat-containing protein, partial [Chromatiales bacterium]|nr:right-handed parallel beta-helix repeat-containing protein [Chromatiales bacterium]